MKPLNSIHSIKENSTTHEIIPNRLGKGSYVAEVPNLTQDETLALAKDVPSIPQTSIANQVLKSTSTAGATSWEDVDYYPTSNSAKCVSSGGVYSSKLGSPQNNYVTSKLGIASSVNQGGTVWSSSDIDRACIVYIRGQFTGSSLFTLYSSDGTARVYREITGVNSISFLCKKGDYIVWTTKGTTAWADSQKINFGGVVDV